MKLDHKDSIDAGRDNLLLGRRRLHSFERALRSGYLMRLDKKVSLCCCCCNWMYIDVGRYNQLLMGMR
jgi:hypothetical protein